MAAGVLSALDSAGHEIALVVTAPDRRRGRGGAVGASPVKLAAEAIGAPVSERATDVLEAGVDLGVVVAYGYILKPPLLGGVPLVNMHFSLLPRWRGAAPVERAILAGDEETGVCLMEVEAGLDTGPVYACLSTPIVASESATDLRDRLAELGTGLLLERLADPPDSLGEALPQVGEPTYAAKIEPAELHLDWSRPAVELERIVRVGRAFTGWRGERLIVHRAHVAPAAPDGAPPGTLAGDVVATGDGGLELVEVQPAGRGRQSFRAWANGAQPVPGERLGDDRPD